MVALPTSSLISDTIVCFEDMVRGMNLNPGNDGVKYLWNTGDTTQILTVIQKGDYSVTITNSAGCSSEDAVNLLEDCNGNIWLPSAFTPDGDGKNETFVLQGRGIETVELMVFNRWGELIWTGKSLGDSWDGKHKGNEVPIDVYVWKLSYSAFNHKGVIEQKTKIGHVALVR